MSLLKFTNHGIYCPRADVYIDPWKPVNRALITHAHSDHARAGHKKYLAHTQSASVMRLRLGADINLQTLKYNQTITINGVAFSFHPAGHIPGSAQIRVAYKGEVWVASGDYKLEDDGISTLFEPVKCTHFITESTFGLPIYKWQKQAAVMAEINTWWRHCAENGKVAIISAYALGKAQRIINHIDQNIGPIYTHGAVENSNVALRQADIEIAPTHYINENTTKKDLKGALVVCPPGAMGSAWMRKLGPSETAFASGWMALRGARRRRAMDRGFILSDHADWNELNQAVLATEAENIYVTHGYQNAFTRWLKEEHGLNAISEKTLFEGESLEGDKEKETSA